MTAPSRHLSNRRGRCHRTVAGQSPRPTCAAYLAACCQTCTDYYKAAALYEKLSALSDPELQRRGLSRAMLAQHICSVCDRSAAP